VKGAHTTRQPQPHISRYGLALAARRLLPFRLRLVLAVCGVVAWLVDIAAHIHVFSRFFMADGLTYAAAGRHLLAGEPLYSLFQLSAPYPLAAASFGQGFVYPPTAALLFTPLAWLGTEGLGLAFGGIWVLFGALVFRLARWSGLAVAPAALFTLVVAISGPAISGASAGNMNLLIADALLASWLWPRSAGVLAVLGGAIKLFPAAGMIWTIRRHGSLLWPLALGIGLLVAATLIVGTSGWSDFLSAFGHGRSSSGYSSPGQLLGPGLGTAVGLGLAAAAGIGVWRIRDDAVAFALLGWAMILPAPDWESHYLLLPLAASLPWLTRWLAGYLGRPALEPDNPAAGIPGHRAASI
jgi:hypothetical protein